MVASFAQHRCAKLVVAASRGHGASCHRCAPRVGDLLCCRTRTYFGCAAVQHEWQPSCNGVLTALAHDVQSLAHQCGHLLVLSCLSIEVGNIVVAKRVCTCQFIFHASCLRKPQPGARASCPMLNRYVCGLFSCWGMLKFDHQHCCLSEAFLWMQCWQGCTLTGGTCAYPLQASCPHYICIDQGRKRCG